MFKKTLIAAAIAGAIMASTVYAADTSNDDNRMYISGMFGASIVSDVDTTAKDENNSATTDKLKADYSTGFHGLAAVGYTMGDMAAEIQSGYIHANVNTMKLDGTERANSGQLDVIPVMFNGYYHFTSLSDMLVPYIGAGVGYANVRSKFKNVNDSTNTGNNEASKGTLGYQAMVGLGYHLTDNAALNFEYRYFGTSNADFEYNRSSVNYKAEDHVQDNMLNVGFTWYFD